MILSLLPVKYSFPCLLSFESSTMDPSSQHIIQEGNCVLLKKEDNLSLQKAQKDRETWLEGIKVTLAGIIGHPWGTRFKVQNGAMVKVTKVVPQTLDSAEKGAEEGRDNRNLYDRDSNQKLTADEIDQMKKEGVSGEKLIEQLIENSATFQNKTEYSQEKYVKKKKKKHLMEFTILKPTARLLCEMNSKSKGPNKICNMRVDSLGQLLTWANVRAGCTVAVVEACMGLVTGAVMERLGGFGTVINLYHGDVPSRNILDAYDFPQEIKDTLLNFPLDQLNAAHRSLLSGSTTATGSDNKCESNGVAGDKPTEASATDSKVENTEDVNNKMDTAEDVKNSDSTSDVVENKPDTLEVKDSVKSETPTEVVESDNISEASKEDNVSQSDASKSADTTSKPGEEPRPDTAVTKEASEKGPDGESQSKQDGGGREGKSSTEDPTMKRGKKRRTLEERLAAQQSRNKDREKARNLLMQGNIDCLIVVTKFHPTPIVLKLVDFLAPSRQVVVFSQFKEALEDCYVHLREHSGLVSYRLTETWLRNYQVLPNRTHPVIQMSGTGGYLLTATTVVSPGKTSDDTEETRPQKKSTERQPRGNRHRRHHRS